MDVFVNFSNHPSRLWSKDQRDAVNGMEIVDVPFPDVDPSDTVDYITEEANKCVNEIMKENPSIVMAQGEFSLTFAAIRLLKQKKVKVVCACSRRETMEQIDVDGIAKKVATFKFIQFREYI